MLEESQEEVLFVLEMGIDRPLAPACRGGNIIQLGAFKSIPDEHFFRGVEKPSLCFLYSKLLSGQGFHGHYPI
jgi:hypothetical protein